MTHAEAIAVLRRIARELEPALDVAEAVQSPSGSFFVGLDTGLRIALVSPAAAQRAVSALDALVAEFGPAAVGPISAVASIVHALAYEEGSDVS